MFSFDHGYFGMGWGDKGPLGVVIFGILFFIINHKILAFLEKTTKFYTLLKNANFLILKFWTRKNKRK